MEAVSFESTVPVPVTFLTRISDLSTAKARSIILKRLWKHLESFITSAILLLFYNININKYLIKYIPYLASVMLLIVHIFVLLFFLRLPVVLEPSR